MTDTDWCYNATMSHSYNRVMHGLPVGVERQSAMAGCFAIFLIVGAVCHVVVLIHLWHVAHERQVSPSPAPEAALEASPAEMADMFCAELHVQGTTAAEKIDAACDLLGVSKEGSDTTKARACWTVLRGPVVEAPEAPRPQQAEMVPPDGAVRRSATRKQIKVGAIITFMLSGFAGSVVILFFIGNDMAFGAPGVAMVALCCCAGVSFADVAFQRISRLEMAMIILLTLPGATSIFVSSSVAYVLGVGQGFWTRPQQTVAAVSFGAMALVEALCTIYLMPCLYATPRLDGDVRKLLSEQRMRAPPPPCVHTVAAVGLPHVLAYYYLEGADVFEMPVAAAIERLFRAVQVAGGTCGLLLTAMAVALAYLDCALPVWVTVGSLIPIGVALLVLCPLCFAPCMRDRIQTAVGGAGWAAITLVELTMVATDRPLSDDPPPRAVV